MLEAIIRFSIRNKALVGLMMVGLVLWGVYSLTQLPIDAVPDITNNQVQVLTTAPSQSAQDIERLVTFPIEQTMTTIPGIEEIRSFSRFGLSVVTLVFKENIDIYWARQQVGERLVEAKTMIPDGVGSPEMAPVTTGLGEIYQYVLRPKPGYESKFDIMELRTLQDWIVRRQLLGVEGVADVSSFGGYLKQYEIALDPTLLRSMDVSIGEVFAALEANNQNTGGSYIDKHPYAWFIRSEGLIDSLADIRNIAVKLSANGVPVLMQDIAKVRMGHAQRYGAMTRDDKGEVVGAVVMMLKGANSSKVIHKVKERIAQIEKTLPEGVAIEPYLDRTRLVDKAISTVVRNLTEGALIVIFVLVLLLGNWRGGFIVASVIPLAMLFAIAMMNLFGVSGNLMSLGAIDFGLIVDGAVIIVEATLHHLSHRKGKERLTQSEMDEQVQQSAGSIMSSAAFGEIIILIVYLPILALVGVEGKMFKPMAQTVSFAILGAFLLSLTYVPMISSLLLSKRIRTKPTISDRLMQLLQFLYGPTLKVALRLRWLVIGAAILFLLGGGVVFSFLGAEFIPTLEEGDFAVETRILTGSSMEETVRVTQASAKVLKANFPEVKTVIGKIGSSEIPTDPMPVESADLIVVLKDQDQWTSAKNREELADKMHAQLVKEVPGVTYGFQQPIQMRFNELMSGARQDVVVKIYGEDLDTLARLAAQVGDLVATTKGAKDLYVEQVGGLSQIVVEYKRDQIARHGLSIREVNEALNTAFAGQSTGKVYEGERRFDLVVRMGSQNRQSIDDVRNLPIATADGHQIPLSVVADVEFKVGPNQIQRDDAKRRIIVGFNVRERDVESVVQELQQAVDAKVKFPDGYYPKYGGTFENLIAARERLSVAVPVALLLIFLLLFFTFSSLRQSLLIFTAIPLSAIGGILALWTRGMPFSISAGVGFIALFGVAVLNGIVLIAEFNRLKRSGMTDLKDIIMTGTATRLRPVLMTAAVASLGFLPMAISSSEGAEVQRPLATVVIGGLITATLLTLVVLPCLYYVSEGGNRKRRSIPSAAAALLLPLILLLPGLAYSQNPNGIRFEEAMKLLLSQNAQVQTARQSHRIEEQAAASSSLLPKLDVNLTLGQYNSAYRGDNNLTVSQSIPFPTTFGDKKAVAAARVGIAGETVATTENEAGWELRKQWLGLQYLYAFRQHLRHQDSIYAALGVAAELRYKTGESSLLEPTSVGAQSSAVRNRIRENEVEIDIALQNLARLLHIPGSVAFSDTNLRPYLLPQAYLQDSGQAFPYRAVLSEYAAEALARQHLERSLILPDIKVGYFNQTLVGLQTVAGNEVFFGPNKRFQGFSVGLGIPIWLKPELAKYKAAQLQVHKATTAMGLFDHQLENELSQARLRTSQRSGSLKWYLETGLPNAALILEQSSKAYAAGEIDAMAHLYALRQSLDIEAAHLLAVRDYNEAVLHIQFLIGQSSQINFQ